MTPEQKPQLLQQNYHLIISSSQNTIEAIKQMTFIKETLKNLKKHRTIRTISLKLVQENLYGRFFCRHTVLQVVTGRKDVQFSALLLVTSSSLKEVHSSSGAPVGSTPPPLRVWTKVSRPTHKSRPYARPEPRSSAGRASPDGLSALASPVIIHTAVHLPESL